MKKIKILLALLIITIITFVFDKNVVIAAVQSNGKTPINKNRNTWFQTVRSMEAIGGGFGLEESINNNLTATTNSNNIDIHFQKNTEYGAMVLLSTSSYGKSDKILNGETTTGNETGIKMPYNKEWTATQIIKSDNSYKLNYDERYVDYYELNNFKGKSGDATIETNQWHGGNAGSVGGDGFGGLVRMPWDPAKSIFEWSVCAHSSYYDREAAISNNYATRAVVVNGEGI